MDPILGFIVELSDEEISSWVSRYLWPFFRIAGFFMVVPLFGTRLVTQRIRLLLAAFTALVITPVLPPMPSIDALSVATMNYDRCGLRICIGYINDYFCYVRANGGHANRFGYGSNGGPL